MPASVIVQFCLITALTPMAMTVFAWTLLLMAMTMPYVFAGVAVSLALTRSPFRVGLVYGVDLLGAAVGCAAVIWILNVLDGPSAILLAGLGRRARCICFCARGHSAGTDTALAARTVGTTDRCRIGARNVDPDQRADTGRPEAGDVVTFDFVGGVEKPPVWMDDKVAGVHTVEFLPGAHHARERASGHVDREDADASAVADADARRVQEAT